MRDRVSSAERSQRSAIGLAQGTLEGRPTYGFEVEFFIGTDSS